MKFKSHIYMNAPGVVIRRDPGFWESFTKLFGAEPDLATSRVRANVTAAQLLSGAKKALERCGVDNAIALTVDNYVLFEDKAGAKEDLVDLFTAFYKNEVVYGRDFKTLILAVEHVEAGLHYVIELEARSEHEADEATVRLFLSGRITDFQPRPGESGEAFRKRVTPHLETPAFVEVHRLQFESFVARIQEGLVAGLPEIKVAEAKAVVEAVRPPTRMAPSPGRRPPRRVRDDRRYDPFDRYYPRRATDIAERFIWNSMVMWQYQPGYHVVDMSGQALGVSDSMGDLSAVALWDRFELDGSAAIGAGAGDVGGMVGSGLGEVGEGLGEAGAEIGADIGAEVGADIAADVGVEIGAEVGSSLGDAASSFDFFDIDWDFF